MIYMYLAKFILLVELELKLQMLCSFLLLTMPPLNPLLIHPLFSKLLLIITIVI